MRYIFQIVVMLTDILIIGSCAFVICNLPWQISLIFVYLAYSTWKSTGGFIAWTHWRQFLKNAKKIGF